MIQPGATCGEEYVIVVGQAVLIFLGDVDVGEGRRGISASEYRRQDLIGHVVRRIQIIIVWSGVDRRRLAGQEEVWARLSVFIDYAFGEKVGKRFPCFRLVGCENVIEGTVFSDDHDDMLNR